MPQYTDADLLTHLRDFAAEIGETPTQRQVDAAGEMPGAKTYDRRFGSWNNALREAGLDPNQEQQQGFSDEELLDRLQAFAAEIGETPTQEQIRETDDLPSPKTYHNRFGSWTDALRKAGLDPTPAHRQGFSDEELLDRLQAFAADLGETPTTQQVNAADEIPSFTPYHRRFGSWNNALREAGLDPNQEHLSDEKLLDRLREFAAELKATPTSEQVTSAEGLPSPDPYYNRFGNWDDVLTEAGLELNGVHTRSDANLLDALREFVSDCDGVPTAEQVDAADEMPPLWVYTGRFGSLSTALEAAGLTPKDR